MWQDLFSESFTFLLFTLTLFHNAWIEKHFRYTRWHFRSIFCCFCIFFLFSSCFSFFLLLVRFESRKQFSKTDKFAHVVFSRLFVCLWLFKIINFWNIKIEKKKILKNHKHRQQIAARILSRLEYTSIRIL